ncbi:MAG: heavy-metal-associated domain-containing protein [Bryobacter sp.]|nr:heavy-metal-associated domain-containing protein [Bryobacter sp.]
MASESLALKIGGMHCGGCVNRVTNALKSVESVEVNKVEIGAAEVAYDPERADRARIAAAVEKIGFTVES